MSSPRVRRRSVSGKRRRLSRAAPEGKENSRPSQRIIASGAFDSGINDSDLQLAGIDLSWSQTAEPQPCSPPLTASSPRVTAASPCAPPRLLQRNGDLPAPGSGLRSTAAPQDRPSLRARIQARIEANSRTPTRGDLPRPQEEKEEKEEKAEEKAVLSLDTQQREFVARRLDEAEPTFFGLPRKVAALLEEHRGIKKLFSWQEECLRLPAVAAGRNLIYSLPTSGGKTLVAELLILQQLLLRHKDALLVLPYVSVVQEKAAALTPLGLGLDFLVEEYAGSRGRLPPTRRRRRRSVFVATMEKAHALVNALAAEGRLDDLGLAVLDELHMVGDGGMRGAGLEMTITKLLAASPSTRLVGMSATLSNIDDLCRFMDAELYTSDFRPVELREFVKLEESVFEIDNRPGRVLSERLVLNRVVASSGEREARSEDPDGLCGLVREVVPEHACLVFCPTKRQCESLADLLARRLPSSLGSVRSEERREVVERLAGSADGRLCPVLARTLPMGVAYHHSGLTADERRAVEEGYLSGAVNVLCSTSTLAAGVNLPAKRVILRSPYMGARFLSPSEYRQMIGRAGRAGLDSSGESIVVLKPQDKAKFVHLLTSALNACDSSLLCEDGRGLQTFVLSALTLQLASDFPSVHRLVARTLLAQQRPPAEVLAMLREQLQALLDAGLIEQVASKSPHGAGEEPLPLLRATGIGRASVRGGVDPGRSQRLVEDLRAAQEGLNMTSHLHLIYLVTPYDLAETMRPDWALLYRRLEALTPSELSLLSNIGLSEAYVARKASGQNWRKPVDALVVGRVYLALLLYDLWRQESVWTVAERYGLPRGVVQQALASASAMAAGVAHFVAEFEEFWAYKDLLPAFARQLAHCANTELLPLMELPGVRRARARQLYEAGFLSLAHVAHAESSALAAAVAHLSRRAARQMVSAARMLLAEAADTLMEEAQRVLAVPSDPAAAAQDDSDLFA